MPYVFIIIVDKSRLIMKLVQFLSFLYFIHFFSLALTAQKAQKVYIANEGL